MVVIAMEDDTYLGAQNVIIAFEGKRVHVSCATKSPCDDGFRFRFARTKVVRNFTCFGKFDSEGWGENEVTRRKAQVFTCFHRELCCHGDARVVILRTCERCRQVIRFVFNTSFTFIASNIFTKCSSKTSTEAEINGNNPITFKMGKLAYTQTLLSNFQLMPRFALA